MDDTREIKTTALPTLDNGQIWGTTNLGVFVVVSQRPAAWRGDDRDVYGHIDTWYTIRAATVDEQQLWDAAVNAAKARRDLRKQLGVGRDYEYHSCNMTLSPPEASTQMLDSYDDRWQPPRPIQLTPEQAAIEGAYVDAYRAIKNH